MTAAAELFRFAPARLVLQMMAAQNLALVAVYAGFWAFGRTGLPSLPMLAVGGGQVLGGAALFWLLFRRSGVRVGPAGLAFVAPLAAARRVAWDDIDTARPRQIGIVPQLVLRGPGVLLAFPFTLVDPDGFAEAVAHYAGGDHPLTVAVRQRLAAD